MTIYDRICETVDERLKLWTEPPTADRPFQLNTYGFEFEYPINPRLEKLPSVTLTYGGFREGPPDLAQADATIFTLTIYTVLKALTAAETFDNKDRDLLQACRDMHAAMIKLKNYLLTAGLTAEDGVVDQVKLARGRSGEGKFTKVELLQFYFDFYITEELPSVF